MVRSYPFRLLTGFAVSAALALSACGGQSGNDRPSGDTFDYTPPTGAQLQEIQTLWASRDLGAKNVSVFYRDDSNVNYELRIYQHVVGGGTHYGAVTIPKNSPRTSFPAVVFAAGLSQDNPTMDIGVGHRPRRRGSARPFSSCPCFAAAPSFTTASLRARQEIFAMPTTAPRMTPLR